MRPQAVAWERAAEVREAARGWLRVGAIDRATHEAIRTAYPDPCVTPAAVWRILTAVMVTAVVWCTLGAVLVATRPAAAGLALLLFVFAAALVVATERLAASPRLARRGAAGATSFWAVVLLCSPDSVSSFTRVSASASSGLSTRCSWPAFSRGA
jgi:hypothetical protein